MLYQASYVAAGGVIQFGSGPSFDTKQFDELPRLFDKVEKQRETAISRDERELEIAVEELKGYCSDGWDKQASNMRFAAVKTTNMAIWRRFVAHYQNILKTKDNPSRILNTTYPDWVSAVERLSKVEQEVPKLTVDSWQGEGANAYRARLPQRQTEVQRTRKLAEASRNGIEAQALLQAAILEALHKSMTVYSDQIDTYLATVPLNEPLLRQLFKNSYFDFKWNNQAQHAFKFFRRTQTLTRVFTQMAKDAGLRLDNQSQGEWVPSSEEIKTYLEQAMEAAKSGEEVGDFDGKGYDPDFDPTQVQAQEGTKMV